MSLLSLRNNFLLQLIFNGIWWNRMKERKRKKALFINVLNVLCKSFLKCVCVCVYARLPACQKHFLENGIPVEVENGRKGSIALLFIISCSQTYTQTYPIERILDLLKQSLNVHRENEKASEKKSFRFRVY